MNSYFVMLAGLGFAGALILVYIIAQYAQEPRVRHTMNSEPKMDDLSNLLTKASTLPGVAVAMEMYRRVAQHDAAFTTYRGSGAYVTTTTVATGTTPSSAIIVPPQQ